MKPKSIVIAILLAVVIIILFNNKEESTFWLFGDIRTSKLIILCIFFLLGIITGGILFGRKKKHPKDYTVSNPNHTSEQAILTPTDESFIDSPYKAHNDLSDEDKDFLRRD